MRAAHRTFGRDQRGFTGAEKALLLCFALAVVTLGGYLLSQGSRKAGDDARQTLLSGTGSLSLGARPGEVLAPGSLPRAYPESRQDPEAPTGTTTGTTTPARPGPLQDPAKNPDPTNEYVPDATYKEVRGEVAVKGRGDDHAFAPKDAVQGQLGDCYFIAQLAAQARANPGLLEQAIKDHGNGTYTVTLYLKDPATGKRERKDIVVDSQFPHKGDRVAYAQPGDKGDRGPELWAMLIEKAFAKSAGSYENIRGKKTPDGDVFALLSGTGSSEFSPKSVAKDELLKRLDKALRDGKGVTFGALGTPTPESKAAGVVANHAYSLESVDLEKGTVTLRNPWGVQHLENFPIERLQKFFPEVTIAGKGK